MGLQGCRSVDATSSRLSSILGQYRRSVTIADRYSSIKHMANLLKTHQRQFALQRMAFGFTGFNLLSPEVGEALRRACLACAEN